MAVAVSGKPKVKVPANGNGKRSEPASHDAAQRGLLSALRSVAKGEFGVRLPTSWLGMDGDIAEAFNEMVATNARVLKEMERISAVVGHDGRIGQRTEIVAPGGFGAKLQAMNRMIDDLTQPIAETSRVLGSVARGDLSQQMVLEVDGRPLKGEFLRSSKTINAMVDQLNAFAFEVTRVAREVGSEGKLGGQAKVQGVAGTWKDLTDSVNSMAGNLTNQVSGIVKVVTAVANGNLRQKLTVEAKGEVAGLAETINNMTATLATFAEQVTNVDRKVGVDGRLGGQAHVPGAAGTWKDLTGNVNLLAANLTTQVRAIAEVATAVTKGDLTRSIQAEARGEVAELKDNINTMIDNLRLTTDRNTEQDWLKTNLAKFTNMLQGQRDIGTVGRLLLTELTPLVNAQLGVIYQVKSEETQNMRL